MVIKDNIISDKKIHFENEIIFVRKALLEGNFEEAKKALSELLPSGYAEAEYLSSSFSLPNEDDSVFDLRRLSLIRSSAKKKYPPALYMLGYFYDTGELVKKNKKVAADFFREAAELGHAHSQYIYANDLLYGTNGIAQNIVKGVKWLRKSASQKFEGALILLSELYSNGDYGLPKDSAMAKKLINKLKDVDMISY